MTTKEPSNVIKYEILISVEQPEIEDYDNLCVSNTFCFIKLFLRCYVSLIYAINSICFINFCFICYVSLVSAGLFLIGIIILILSQYN